jgi:hypothetical protein
MGIQKEIKNSRGCNLKIVLNIEGYPKSPVVFLLLNYPI